MSASVKEYRGAPVLMIQDREDEKYPFSFGIRKAKMILNNIEAIEIFVKKFDKQNQTQGETKHD